MPEPAYRVAELLAGATDRTRLADAPGKSGARLERVVIDGQQYVLKHLDLAEDWTMRASGCLRGAPLVLWERGILARLPGCLNQPIVGAAREPGGCALLMRDVTPWLVPATDEPITLDQHTGSCGTWPPCTPSSGTAAASSTSSRPCTATWSCLRGWPRPRPPRARRTWSRSWSRQGWPLLAEVAPAAAAVVTPLAHDPGPLVEALAGTPQTFVHSNWKLDNLGTDDDGRTVLLDWEQPGRGAPLSDLAWYLAINCRRLPQSKEDSIAAYRQALEGLRRRHRPLVGPPAGAVPARRPGPVRLGEGARRLRRGARVVGDEGGPGGRPAE